MYNVKHMSPPLAFNSSTQIWLYKNCASNLDCHKEKFGAKSAYMVQNLYLVMDKLNAFASILSLYLLSVRL